MAARPSLSFANPKPVPEAPQMPTVRKRPKADANKVSPQRPPAAPEEPETPSPVESAAEGVSIAQEGDAEAVKAPRKRVDRRVRNNTSVDIDVALAQRVRNAVEASSRGGKRGLGLITVVLMAVRDQRENIQDLWKKDAEAEADELFPGLEEKVAAADTAAARPTTRLQLSGMTPTYAASLDKLVKEYGAPSRKALIEAALERQYPAKGRR